MDHPDIERTMRLGYPDKLYLDWEREEELGGGETNGEDACEDVDND